LTDDDEEEAFEFEEGETDTDFSEVSTVKEEAKFKQELLREPS
jgi:hypothetical protein